MLNTFTRHRKNQDNRKSQNPICSQISIINRLNANIDAIATFSRQRNLHLVSQSPKSSSRLTTSSTEAQNYNTTVPKPNSKTSTRSLTKATLKLIHLSNQANRTGSDKKMLNHIHYLSALLLTICATLLSQSQIASADSLLQSKLQALKISPDIINVPSGVETIKLEVHGNNVKPGDPVPAKYFKDLNLDKITWDVSNFDARHTLILLDLDRKSAGANNNTINIYNQFTSLNIPGNVIKAGQNIAAFDTPTIPCAPTTKHRLLMLAFHQKQNIDIADVAYISTASGHSPKRENFKINDFMNKHRLELVAANVILASGETGGVCSGSISSHRNISSILFAMVTAVAAFQFKSRRLAIF